MQTGAEALFVRQLKRKRHERQCQRGSDDAFRRIETQLREAKRVRRVEQLAAATTTTGGDGDVVPVTATATTSTASPSVVHVQCQRASRLCIHRPCFRHRDHRHHDRDRHHHHHHVHRQQEREKCGMHQLVHHELNRRRCIVFHQQRARQQAATQNQPPPCMFRHHHHQHQLQLLRRQQAIMRLMSLQYPATSDGQTAGGSQPEASSAPSSSSSRLLAFSFPLFARVSASFPCASLATCDARAAPARSHDDTVQLPPLAALLDGPGEARHTLSAAAE